MNTSPEEIIIYVGPAALAAAVISGLGSSSFWMGFLLGTIILIGFRVFYSGDTARVRELFSRRGDDTSDE